MGTAVIIPNVATVKNWSPGQIPNLFGLYDFMTIGNLWQDTARTSPVTTDAQSIAGVTDGSGNANHLSQSSAGARPTYKTGIMNGQSVARFDGGDFLASASYGVALAQPGTVVIAASNTDTGADSWLFSGGPGWIVFRANGSPDKWGIYAGGTLTGSATADGSAHIFAGIFNGASSNLYVGGGTADISGPAGANTLPVASIGAASGPSSPIIGDVAMVAIYSAILTADQLNMLGFWLKFKTALAWGSGELMGVYVKGVYVPTLAEIGWDSEVSDALRQLGEVSVNVKAAPYGATADGVTDDGPSIQGAIDGSGWPANKATILIPPGTYHIGPTGLVVDGGGAVSTPPLTILGWGATLETQTQSTSPLLDITNSIVSTTYVSVLGLAFLTNASPSPYRTGIRLNNAQDSLIHGCKFQGNFGLGVEFKGLSNYNRISDSSFLYLRRGIQFTESGNLTSISGCRFEEGLFGAPLNWIDSSNPSSPTDLVTIANNVFYSPGATLGSIRIDNGNNWTIANNVFQFSYQESIRIGGNGNARGHSINGNTFYHGMMHDIYIAGAQRNTIVGNVFDIRDSSVTDNTYSAVRITNTGGFDAGYYNIVANNNSMDTATKLLYMIELEDTADYCVVTGNIGRAGIRAVAVNNQVANNLAA